MRVSTPGGEPNAVCMTRHLQAIEGAVCVLFAFHRANDHTIPAIVGGDFRVKAFERQLSTYRLCLFRASERTALHHPAAFVFFLRRRFWRGVAMPWFSERYASSISKSTRNFNASWKKRPVSLGTERAAVNSRRLGMRKDFALLPSGHFSCCRQKTAEKGAETRRRRENPAGTP